MLSLKSPPLSRIEHFEALRRLSFMRRLQYAFWFGFLTIIVFAVICAITSIVLLPIIQSVIPRRWTIGDHVMIVISIVGTFLIAISLTQGELPERIMPQDTLRRILRRSAWQGAVMGFFVGLVFGIIWAFAVRIGLLYTHINTMYNQAFFVEDLLLYGGLMGLFVAPMFGLFRASTSALSYGLLSIIKE